MKRVFSIMMPILLLASMLAVSFTTRNVEATGTVYIRADGSIDPPTAPISTLDLVTYTFTNDIYDEIVVERSNIIVDGNGYTLQGSGSGNGFYWSGINNVTIQNTNIKHFYYGILLSFFSNYNSISGSNITANNEWGIWLSSSSNNKLFHNSFVNNNIQVYSSGSANIWDDGYPSGGNYWSDYGGADAFSGTYQNETGSDGIVDTPYIIDANNTDRYPLMPPWGPLIGDANGDGTVDIYDLILVAVAYGSTPTDPNWNPNADINGDGAVDIYDLILVASHFGETIL